LNYAFVNLLSVGDGFGHYMALAAVGTLIAAHWRLTDANMQDDLVAALRASPGVVSFRCWFVEQD